MLLQCEALWSLKSTGFKESGAEVCVIIQSALKRFAENNSICDCLSENPPSSHLPVFWEIPFYKIQLKNQPCLGSGVIHWV